MLSILVSHPSRFAYVRNKFIVSRRDIHHPTLPAVWICPGGFTYATHLTVASQDGNVSQTKRAKARIRISVVFYFQLLAN